jgi:hypothetical protein
VHSVLTVEFFFFSTIGVDFKVKSIDVDGKKVQKPNLKKIDSLQNLYLKDSRFYRKCIYIFCMECSFFFYEEGFEVFAFFMFNQNLCCSLSLSLCFSSLSLSLSLTGQTHNMGYSWARTVSHFD